MQEHLGIIGAYIVLAAHIPLYVATLRKTAKPNLATWSMWSVMLVITLASQIAAGKTDPWGMLAAAGGTIVATILLLIYGEKKWTKFDTRCLLLATAGMLVWKISGPAAAQVASLMSLMVAGVPTIRNAWENPSNESKLTWGTFSLGFALTVVAVSNWTSVTNWIQPVTSTAFNLTVFVLTLRRSTKT